jgi:imidazolonepropionase-like amidohydrolase
MADYWIVGARVVDGTGADPVQGLDIHVVEGRIAALGRAPGGVETLDATGLTITPGLIDAHVHLGMASVVEPSLRHELSVAEIAADMFDVAGQSLDAGFTTVRDVGGIDRGMADVVAKGKVRGPRILQSGPVQCQTGGHGHLGPEWAPTSLWDRHSIPGLRCLSLLSDGPDEMRKNVREAFRRGADFIKMCVTGGVLSTTDELTDTQLTVEEIAVAVQEASARGTYVTVHAHNNDGIRNAVRAGVKCVEHGSQIDEATAALMAAHGVAHVPTFAVDEQFDDPSSPGLPPGIAERNAILVRSAVEAVHLSRAAGVTVGLGSDLLGPDQSRRGRELVIRAEIETPMLALRSATQINAQILRINDQTGTIEVGKVADLTGFAGDPLEHPKLFGEPESVALVIKAGRVVKDTR